MTNNNLHDKKRLYRKQLMSNFKIDECPHCHSKNIISEETEIYCPTCGLILCGLYEKHEVFVTEYSYGYIL